MVKDMEAGKPSVQSVYRELGLCLMLLEPMFSKTKFRTKELII